VGGLLLKPTTLPLKDVHLPRLFGVVLRRLGSSEREREREREREGGVWGGGEGGRGNRDSGFGRDASRGNLESDGDERR
jgi:hypothetical protein